MDLSLALDPALGAALRGALALLFAVAALHKLRDPLAFRAAFLDYRVLAAPLARALAPLVPAAETAAALALLAPAFAGRALLGAEGLRAAGPLLAAGLLGLYGAAIALNLARGRRHVDCGCLGPALRQPLSGWLVARNALLAGAALACLLPAAPRALVWLDALTVGAAVALLALLWSGAHQALANAPGRARLRVPA
jgi:hypothetical protein